MLNIESVLINENMERLQPEERHESMRGYFAYEVYNAMVQNPNIVVLTGDLGYGMWDKVKQDFPDNFYNFGAAEQVLLGAAVGFAEEGKVPIVYSITPFLLYRGFETIRNYIDHESIPVKLIGSGRNQDYAHDGFSHFAGDDRLLFESGDLHQTAFFKNITAVWPQDKTDIPHVVEGMIYTPKPFYINLSR